MSSIDSTLEDIKNLKVCIELNGLRLNKSRLPGEVGQWLSSSERSAEVDRKTRMDATSVRERSEVNSGWCEPRFLKSDAQRGKRLYLNSVSVWLNVNMIS